MSDPIYLKLTSLGIGRAIGGTAGAATSLVVDTNNRQLHPSETARIKQLAKGDAQKEAKLTAAACALVRCADGVPTDDPAYAYLKGLQDAGEQLTSEQALLANQKGWDGRTYGNLFNYTIGNDIQDYLDQSKTGTRILGAVQAVAGVVGAAGSVALCDTGIGCAAGAITGPISIDYGKAGLSQALTGEQQVTYGEQVLQSLGLSTQAAAITYATLGMSPAAVEALAVNKAVNQAAQYNKLVKSSYADFTPNGIKATPEIMATPQVQALIKEIQAGSPELTLSDVKRYAIDYIESGISLPQTAIATPGSVLVKVMPAGQTPSATTGFWMSPKQARAIATMTPEQVGQSLGLPATQAAQLISGGLDFYAISPKPGVTANVFVSNITNTSQGEVNMIGGAQQVIVPNRSQWTNPTAVNPFTLRPAGVK